MLAVLDETYPTVNGHISYVVGSAVILADEQSARTAVDGILPHPDRVKPFHWHKEGPKARAAMVNALVDVGAVAHICVHHPTGPKRLEAARRKAVGAVLLPILNDGASRLLIESRGPVEDRRDQKVILDTLNANNRPSAIAYEWRNKGEKLLWLADGICGAVRGYLLQTDDTAFVDLQRAGVIDALVYV